MHLPPKRLVRHGLPVVAVLALALSGCADPAPGPAAPPVAPAPASSTTAPLPADLATDAGTDGLTVRYLGDDGRVQTVRVEDFPR